VDFAARRERLRELEAGLRPEAIWARRAEGLPKLWVIRQALDLRRRRPALFGPEGGYAPLRVVGEGAIGFVRGGAAAAVAPRFNLAGRPAEAVVHLPAGAWRNVLTGEGVEGGERRFGEIAGRFPVALLEKGNG
jgi:(1->4)-alpha-D-glucan 1-alpha-D-glucosylmutase